VVTELPEPLSRRDSAITHDRYFLDRVTNRIIEIDRGDIYTYAGNYSYYLEKKLYLKSLPSAASASIKACCAVS